MAGDHSGFVLCASRECLIVGGSPTAGTFLLLAQKKGTKEKGTPFHRPFGVPCVARQTGRLRNSRFALRQSSPTAPGFLGKPRRRRRGFGSCGRSPLFYSLPFKGRARVGMGCFVLRSLLCRFVLSSQPGAVKANMFEHVAAQRIVRVYEPPGWLDKTKVPRRGGKEGALLFGYFILGQAK